MSASSKSGLFLMELIIAIAFFAFASAICMQLFAKAHTLSSRSTNMNMAVTAAQNAAECFKGSDGAIDQMAGLLGGQVQDGRVTLRFDQDWSPAEDGRFVLTATLDAAVIPTRLDISVADERSGEVLYALEAKKYIPD